MIIRIIRRKKKGRKEISEVIAFVRKHKGLEYAESKNEGVLRQGYAAYLKLILNQKPKSALIEFVIFSTLRKNERRCTFPVTGEVCCGRCLTRPEEVRACNV
ncbi:MAG: hypothetical protein MZV63_71460 [Marinilabiliales bacterium]|nr:hypothetical protein [Marinilabiliales bacterium]